MSDINDFMLLHLADSALPTGAFAYSAGMEAMLEFGLIPDEQHLIQYIYEFTRQVIFFEIPYLNSFYSDVEASLDEAIRYFDASFIASAMYEASINLGKNWLRMVEEVLQKEELAIEIEQILKRCETPTHYLVVSTITLKQLGFSKRKSQTYHISNVIRDQISAAIRLGIIGPMQGNAIQHFIYEQIASNVAIELNSTFKDACRTGFVPDMAQMLQKNVYSKLFKN